MTTLKQMQLMHQKGLLRRNERFRSHVYEPAQPPTEVRQQITHTLLRRAFDGSARELLQGALAGRRVDAAELAEIRELLARSEGRKEEKR
jgi:predicted transcriptional regulator